MAFAFKQMCLVTKETVTVANNDSAVAVFAEDPELSTHAPLG